ncbi:hypothetical protein C4544_05360 [candidate division WS5 bacterium]|uniref:Uncharacterized protein n=1 Tax=candidate division WS5 bacterium TaxID=2093353 RepID=A0A419DB44_9BACT|nr:MAG: hypothetical protein C4544_05360 [candidate division WS5 bacterium]
MPTYQESGLKKIIDICTVILLILTAGAAFWGIKVGKDALSEYKKMNMVAMSTAILNMDKEIFKKLSDKPYLQAMFVEIPNEITSHQVINLFLEKESQKFEDWKDIPSLYDKLWGFNEFDNKDNSDKSRLREAYFIGEEVLYVVLNAHEAHRQLLISDGDWESWAAYIDDLGTNPLFLAAIYCGHKYGYISKEFAEILKQRLMKKDDISRVIKSIYPEMINSDWVDRIGR